MCEIDVYALTCVMSHWLCGCWQAFCMLCQRAWAWCVVIYALHDAFMECVRLLWCHWRVLCHMAHGVMSLAHERCCDVTGHMVWWCDVSWHMTYGVPSLLWCHWHVTRCDVSDMWLVVMSLTCDSLWCHWHVTRCCDVIDMWLVVVMSLTCDSFMVSMRPLACVVYVLSLCLITVSSRWRLP